MRTPESFEKNAIKKYLTGIGAWFFMPTMTGYGASGIPDICACIAGFFWAIEVKRPGKEPTPLQWRRITECQEAGGQATWGAAEDVIPTIHQWILRTFGDEFPIRAKSNKFMKPILLSPVREPERKVSKRVKQRDDDIE